MWSDQPKNLLPTFKDENDVLVLAGDGHSDSLGHSAKYGSFSISLNSHTIKCWIFNWFRYKLSIMHLNFTFYNFNNMSPLHLSAIKLEEGIYHVEKEGLHRVMNFLNKEGMQVDVFVTDQHRMINKYYFDLWNVAKGLDLLQP